MGKKRIIKAISSVVKPPKGGFFVFVLHVHHCFAIKRGHYCLTAKQSREICRHHTVYKDMAAVDWRMFEV
jgi:hypothetical protein